MATAGSSRPCSGGEHEITHAIDHFFPGTASHGCLVGVAMLFTTFLRGERELLRQLDAALRRHLLPRTPADLGLEDEQFVHAVVHAPDTRPDRYTVLERLELDADGARRALGEHLEALEGPL
jgi:glycerol-1-phosphate dehydrogenase [NAD(P)+]